MRSQQLVEIRASKEAGSSEVDACRDGMGAGGVAEGGKAEALRNLSIVQTAVVNR